MRYLLSVLCPAFALTLALLPLLAAQAQVDTTGGRYYQPVFPQVTITRGVAFGQALNIQGQTVALRLDFYEPTGDSLAQRPLLVFAHEGGFVGGTRDDQYATALATRLAGLGYCVASIDYRLLFFPFDTTHLAGAAFRAMQDMRGAIRFFRADAAGANIYRIDPTFIVAAGASAGAVTALNVAYLNQPSEIPAYLLPQNLGTLEGTSGPAGVSSRVRAVVALCGSLGRPAWLEAGDVPVCLVHGTQDAVVPYGRGVAGGGLPPLRVYGSAIIKPRADAVGVSATLRTLPGAPHVPFDGTSPTALAYADTTFWTIRDFLRPLLPEALMASSPAMVNPPATAYPVPASGAVRLRAPLAAKPFRATDAVLVDAAGRIVRRFRWNQPEQELARGGLPAGIYSVRMPGCPAVRVIFDE